MPVLSNPKHERFAQELSKGKTQEEAYKAAGYDGSAPHACRMVKNGNIQARVAELQQRGAERAEITVQSLIQEAEEARQLAMQSGQPSAAIAAVREKGVLSGKRVERSEAGKPGEFDRMSDDELRQFIAERVSRGGLGSVGAREPRNQSGVRSKLN